MPTNYERISGTPQKMAQVIADSCNSNKECSAYGFVCPYSEVCSDSWASDDANEHGVHIAVHEKILKWLQEECDE